MNINELNKEIVRRIVRVSDPEEIVLFGSHARGDASPESDIDLMVVKSGVQHRRKEAVKIYRALLGLGVPIDIIVATPEILEKYKDRWSLIYHKVLKEGKTIYERGERRGQSRNT